ncbi:putative triosephosphate isomerase [Amylocarpus encephaloides]|uniref:triose-phosphate isomerase n=1 Tax=Amylocarpus encephaloides TaxID=45428 RepID=A0A9P7Y6Z0_9HELO|nr:putative triosephosphate isomerase [Amylocarpus encephaloides]
MSSSTRPQRTIGISLKLYFTPSQTLAYYLKLSPLVELAQAHDIHLFLVPSAVSLPLVLQLNDPTNPNVLPAGSSICSGSTTPGHKTSATLSLGAQDCSSYESGAYTGEVSPLELSLLGCTLVEMGHAERRKLFRESDESVAGKSKAVLRNGMTPLVCIGEKNHGSVQDAVQECQPQITSILDVLETMESSGDIRGGKGTGEIIFAYEPVWAIGQPKPADAKHVVSVVRALREICTRRGRGKEIRFLQLTHYPQLFQEIAPGFKQYPSGSFEYILGTATGIDTTSKNVTIQTSSGATLQQNYTELVIATGSRSSVDIPWKQSLEGTDKTKAVLHEYQERVKSAKHVVVAGAGPTGVETAAELAFEYKGQKEITLVTAGKTVLADLPPSVNKAAENQLKSMGVKVIANTKVTGETNVGGNMELSLSTGETLTTNLYLPTVGVIPNTEFVPSALKNNRGDVVVDGYLKVKGVENIWAVGDVVDVQPSQMAYAAAQSKALSKNLDLVLRGQNPIVYKTDGPPMIAVTLGRSKGTGRMGTWKFPSIIVYFVKGKTLFTEKLPKYVMGTEF